MKRYVLPILVASLLATAAIGYTGPVAKQTQKEMALAGLRSNVVSLEFNGSERASVIVKGTKGATNLGLYVYDSHGNCVAWDDEGNSETSMFAAVDWLPTDKGAYTIEVRNSGFRECKYMLVVR